jgi:hypothetical protein
VPPPAFPGLALGKLKTKQLKGWVIKIYRHFQSMTHSNIED